MWRMIQSLSSLRLTDLSDDEKACSYSGNLARKISRLVFSAVKLLDQMFAKVMCFTHQQEGIFKSKKKIRVFSNLDLIKYFFMCLRCWYQDVKICQFLVKTHDNNVFDEPT